MSKARPLANRLAAEVSSQGLHPSSYSAQHGLHCRAIPRAA